MSHNQAEALAVLASAIVILTLGYFGSPFIHALIEGVVTLGCHIPSNLETCSYVHK